MILGDAKFKEAIDRILEHDLTGYDVYVVGSIIRGKNSNDLDVIIVGEWDRERLESIFEPLHDTENLDLYFQTEPPLAWGCGSRRVRQRQMTWLGDGASLRKRSKGVEMGKFLLRWCNLPTPKSHARGYKYVEPLLVIQNGEQIYF